MRAGDFARRMSRIERMKGSRCEQRGKRFAGKAIRALARRVGAALIAPGGRVIGYRMPNGGVVCVKQRYRDEVAAKMDLARIRQHASHARIPVRAYRCEWCGGYHLTSAP